LVVLGLDKDLLVTTNQWFLVNESDALDQGITLLKKMLNVDNIVLTVPSRLEPGVTCKDAEVRSIGTTYPDGLPKMVMKQILGRTVPAGAGVEQMGAGFINAEAVVALAKAFESGRIPVEKTFTLIGKDGTTHLCRARIGTRIKDILAHMNIETGQGDRIVLGGPMTGESTYTDDMPIRCDTDAILIQNADSIVMNSDNQCINCGECVRACPARMPVNMLVRVLDSGLYAIAAEEYDLLSCVECGLCSYVCVARIPVFQYVMLGKTEFARIQSLEVSNV
jgi:electron transport complex protein RnfC